MKLTTRALTLGVALSLAPVLGEAQTSAPAPGADAPTRSLIEQAQYWQQRGRGDRASEAWNKLLRIVPDQPDALLGLAKLSLVKGDNEAARSYLGRMKAAHPRDSRIAALETQVNLASPGRLAQLDEARSLARSGRADEAVQRYKAVNEGQVPSDPHLALEYYQTLGGAKGGWQDAYNGLQKLARENPSDVQVALALAEHLTYQEPTRRSGIESLARLADRPETAKRARESWRRALSWLGTRPSDVPLYQAWLRHSPDDAEIRQRLVVIAQRAQEAKPIETAADRAAMAEGRAITSAFDTLNDGDLEQARARFNALLAKRPGDTSLLGGLGLIELRESHYAEAESLLERASKASPERWREALNSARYWNRFDQARQARESGQSARALELLRAATRLQAAEPAGQQALGDVLAETGRYAEASAVFQGILKRRPADLDALRGQIGLLTLQGQFDQALAMVDGLSPEQREQIGPLGRMRAERFRRVAGDALAHGDPLAARSALEEALTNDPTNVWVRLDLAKLYLQDSQFTEARGLVDGLLLSEPGLPDGLYASALLSVETRDWPRVLETLQAVRPEARTREMATLYQQAWVRVQVERAAELSRNKQNPSAVAVLQQVEPYVGNDTDLLSAVAAGYADAGDSNRSLNLIRSLMSRSGKPDAALTLRYANILQASKQQVELLGVLRQLDGMTMDATQREAYENLRNGYLLQQADALREAGDLEAAYERVAPVLANQPENAAGWSALARLYASANQHAEAAAIYDQLLARSPNDPDLILSGANAAMGAKQLDRAQTLVEQGLLLRPQDSRMLSLAARVARARGKNRDAEQYLRAAIATEEASKASAWLPGQTLNPVNGQPVATSGVPAAVLNGNNPFAGMTGRRAAPAAVQSSPNAGAMLPGGYLAPVPGAAVRGALPPATNAGSNAGTNAGSSNSAYPAAGSQPYRPYAPINPAATSSTGSSLSPAKLPASSAAFAGTSTGASTGSSTRLAQLAKPKSGKTSKASKSGSRKARQLEETATPVLARSAEAAPARSAAAPALASYPATVSYGGAGGFVGQFDTGNLQNGSAYGAGASAAAAAASIGLPAPYLAQAAGGRPQAGPSLQMSLAPFAPGGVPAASLATAPAYGELPLTAAQRAARAQALAPKSLRDELAELEQDRATALQVGTSVRRRSGEQGLGSLSEFRMPIELQTSVGDGKLSFQAVPTVIDSGAPDSNYNTASRFGGGPAVSLGTAGTPGSQGDQGISLGVGYSVDGLDLRLGTTPLGFRYGDVVGSASWRGDLSDGGPKLGIALSRRLLDDSVLTMAGAHDTRTAESWGGVMDTGLRLDISGDEGLFELYGWTAYDLIDGHEVASNQKTEVGGGMNYRLVASDSESLTVGARLTVLSYQKNQRFFTFGHGGYFSPQTFAALAVPIEWRLRTLKAQYALGGSIGIQGFKESSADYFPDDSTRQAAAVVAARRAVQLKLASTDSKAVYGGQSKLGLAYELHGRIQYQLSQRMQLVAQMGFDNARDYQQFSGGVSLRYAWPQQAEPVVAPMRFNGAAGYR